MLQRSHRSIVSPLSRRRIDAELSRRDSRCHIHAAALMHPHARRRIYAEYACSSMHAAALMLTRSRRRIL